MGGRKRNHCLSTQHTSACFKPALSKDQRRRALKAHVTTSTAIAAGEEMKKLTCFPRTWLSSPSLPLGLAGGEGVLPIKHHGQRGQETTTV